MKFYKKINRKQNSRNGKRVENNFKEIDKGFSKGKKIECFNCGGVGHLSSNFYYKVYVGYLEWHKLR